MSATLAETQRSLEMMTDLAAKYQAERDGFRAALETVAIPAIQDAAATARITECSPIPAIDRLSMRLDRTLETLRAALSGAPVEDPRDARIAGLLLEVKGLRGVLDEAGNHFDHDNFEAARDALARYFGAPPGSCLACAHRGKTKRGESVKCKAAPDLVIPWEGAKASFECPDFRRRAAGVEPTP